MGEALPPLIPASVPLGAPITHDGRIPAGHTRYLSALHLHLTQVSEEGCDCRQAAPAVQVILYMVDAAELAQGGAGAGTRQAAALEPGAQKIEM